jgi:hypothetical protein
VGLIEAEATCLEDDSLIPDAFFAKYATELGPGRLDAASFRASYTQAIRIVPTRYLQWHGRGEAHDETPTAVAERPTASPRAGVLARLSAAVARIFGSQSMSPAAA